MNLKATIIKTPDENVGDLCWDIVICGICLGGYESHDDAKRIRDEYNRNLAKSDLHDAARRLILAFEADVNTRTCHSSSLRALNDCRTALRNDTETA